ncbi:hypothetical protein ACLB2K_040252 [Fragaria x ananassa]
MRIICTSSPSLIHGILLPSIQVVFEAFRSVVRSMWRLSIPVEVQARGDRFLFTFATKRDLNQVSKGGPLAFQRSMLLLNHYDGFFDIAAIPLEFIWIWVEVSGLPSMLLPDDMVGLIGETIRPVLSLDPHGLCVENPRISSPPPKDDMVAEQSRPTCLIVALQPLVFDRARVERGRKTDAENLAAPMILQPCFAASVADDNMNKCVAWCNKKLRDYNYVGSGRCQQTNKVLQRYSLTPSIDMDLFN